MKSYSSIIAFFVVLCFAAPVFAQSTSTVNRKKTIKTPKKPQRNKPGLTKKQLPTKNSKKAQNNLNVRRLTQCLSDIKYATGWSLRPSNRGPDSPLGFSCLGTWIHRTQSGHRIVLSSMTFSGNVKLSCKNGSKCLSARYGTRIGSTTFRVTKKRPGMQSILGCFKFMARVCVK